MKFPMISPIAPFCQTATKRIVAMIVTKTFVTLAIA